MQPPHLSFPSSSTSTFASTYIQRYVRTALSSAGFSKGSGQAIELLTELTERYLLVVGSTLQRNAEHVGRTRACVWDAEVALRELGSSSEEIHDWLIHDGMDVAGQWNSIDDVVAEVEDEEERKLASQRLDEMKRKEEPWISGVKQLEEVLARARPGKEDDQNQKLSYEEISQAQISELEELLHVDEVEEEEGILDDLTSDTSSPRTPHSPSRENGSRAVNGQNGIKRRRSESPGSFIPSFLPSIPVMTKVNDVTTEKVNGYVIEDAEFKRSVKSRLEKGEEKSQAAITNGHEETPHEAATLSAPEENAELPKRSTEDLWNSAVPFTTSILASGQSVDDLPYITEDNINRRNIEGSMSSMHAFANDYPSLVQEARNSEPGYLTPSGPAFMRAFHQRRNLAAYLADSSKYLPCDTLSGSISARPTVMPFTPMSSLLITPPTAENSAPAFSPIRPNGRDLPYSTIYSNALYPACRHRNPANVMNAARLVSGGVGSETYRRMTRIYDPDPILDEQHAERVFHGQPAPKELLVEGNSFLRGALDVLKVKRAEEKAAAREANGNSSPDHIDLGAAGAGTDVDGDRTGQLAMSATRDKIKVKSGTIVSSWDWITRDYTEPLLPGKRFRSGTAGIILGGGSATKEEGRARQRSESVADTSQRLE